MQNSKNLNLSVRKTRIRYCAVNCCENFYGTTDASVHMFRIPKDDQKVQKWLDFLVIESNAGGFVCHKHFEAECMNKDKTRLLSNAVPSIKDSDVETNEINTIDTKKTNDTVDIINSINQSPAIAGVSF